MIVTFDSESYYPKCGVQTICILGLSEMEVVAEAADPPDDANEVGGADIVICCTPMKGRSGVAVKAACYLDKMQIG